MVDFGSLDTGELLVNRQFKDYAWVCMRYERLRQGIG